MSHDMKINDTVTRRNAWIVFSNTDLTEGRGQQIPIAVTDLQATANRLAERKGVMGSDAAVEPVTLFRIEGRWYGPANIEPATPQDITVQRTIDAREAATKRALELGLTPEQIEDLRR